MRHNYISALRREDDSWATTPTELKSIALNFYRDLFTSDGNITTDYPTRGRFPHVNSVSLEHLGDPVSDIENGMVYGTNGIGTWSVLAKVKGWYVEQAAGLLQLDGRTPSTAANGPSVRHGLTHWCPPPEGWFLGYGVR
ncbi:hypothetical protein V6N12_006898 [Hibiscus sabdariffa]|uniref:Uncharacterized protein n=1 Tax=Hibiscus sabdariffa TaxID=183260 RepID=A0ABR2F060_9ROSI